MYPNPKNLISTKYELPCGVILKNRLVKSAMTERISNANFEPTTRHEKLYKKWAETEAGLLITGNVMIDRVHLESAGNVCFDDENMLPKLKKWADAGKTNGNQFWVQISHAGRQTNRFSALRPMAPSEVQLNKIGLFGKPKTMSESDIEDIINGFVRAATISKKAGFTGIQVHSAHGYLLSQFLSPRTNLRKDKWGGSIENRSRLLLTILKETRKIVGSGFPISVKLNSSDFQKGGLSEEESLKVIEMLANEKIDLLEISGGTYEKVAFFLMNEERTKKSTKEREAYFIHFAKKVRSICNLPLLITGGFRSHNFCNEVLSNGEVDLIGMARPFLTNRNEIKDFLNGDIPVLDNLVLRTGIQQFDDSAEAGFYARQLIRMAKGQNFKPNMNPFWCSNFLILHEIRKALSKKFAF
jgi:2,4-dienoyl-CoA reductase-like NADH-dependent reductase (Old Yellow Enzyme family)